VQECRSANTGGRIQETGEESLRDIILFLDPRLRGDDKSLLSTEIRIGYYTREEAKEIAARGLFKKVLRRAQDDQPRRGCCAMGG